MLEKIIAREKPDALLPTLGGQTGLNLAIQLAESGVLERHGVRLIGADREAIRKAEDRKLFKQAMLSIGLEVPRSGLAYTVAEALAAAADLGFPVIVRPSLHPGRIGRRGGARPRRSSPSWRAGVSRRA